MTSKELLIQEIETCMVSRDFGNSKDLHDRSQDQQQAFPKLKTVER
jgi:hypothetical protein